MVCGLVGSGTNHLSLSLSLFSLSLSLSFSLTLGLHTKPPTFHAVPWLPQGVNLIQAVFCAATKFMALFAPPGKHITSEVQADREKQASQKKDKHFGNGCGASRPPRVWGTVRIAIPGTRNPFHERCLLGIGGMVPSGWRKVHGYIGCARARGPWIARATVQEAEAADAEICRQLKQTFDQAIHELAEIVEDTRFIVEARITSIEVRAFRSNYVNWIQKQWHQKEDKTRQSLRFVEDDRLEAQLEELADKNCLPEEWQGALNQALKCETDKQFSSLHVLPGLHFEPFWQNAWHGPFMSRTWINQAKLSFAER